MVMNTVPGQNSWVAAEPVGSALVEACGAKARAQHSLIGAYKPMRQASGARKKGRPRWDTDPRTEHTGVHFQVKPAEHLARVNPSQLAAVVSQGYGRVPITFVHTSSDAGPRPAQLRAPAVLRTQQQHHLYSFSAPCSPSADPRTLLYMRAAAAQPQQASTRAVPAVDLLDRLALLRRITPTTQPTPRPYPLQRHAAAVEHTPGPTPTLAFYTAGSGCGGPTEAYGGWGCGFECAAVERPRPLAVMPAPGWQYRGDCKATQAGGHGVTMAQETSCQTEGLQQNVVVVVTSERPPTACCGEGGEELLSPHPRPAFRPAGQLKHKAPGRPKSAAPARRCSYLSAASGPGRRECGCPRPVPGLADAQRAARRAAEAAREAAEWEHVTVIVNSPCAYCGCGAGSIEEGEAAPAVESDAPGGEASAPLVVSPRRAHADRDIVLVASPRGGSEGETSVVSVKVDHCNSPVITSTYPPSPTCRPRSLTASPAEAAHKQQLAAVAAGVQTEQEQPQQPKPTTFSITLPAQGAKDANFVISANVSSSPGKPPAAAAPAAATTGEAAPCGGAAAATGGWAPPLNLQQGGRHAGELATLTSEIQRRECSFKSMLGELERITVKCSDLASSIAGASGGGRQSPAKRAEAVGHGTYSYTVPAAAELQWVDGGGGGQEEVQQLGSTHSLHSSSSEDWTVGALPPARKVGPGGSRQLACSPCRAGGASATSPASAAPRDAGKEEWSWESLMEFERTIKEQHRKLVEQGLLPPDLS